MLLLVATAAMYSSHVPQQCETYRITGYTVIEFPGITADGTSTTQAIARGEHIVAASYNLPLGSFIFIEGLGIHRVADRGHLDARHLDVLVANREQAYALTGYRTACPLVDGDDEYS